MDDVLKTLIDDYTEMEYRYGKAMAQINAIINLINRVAVNDSDNRFGTLDNVTVDATMILCILDTDYPNDIIEMYKNKDGDGYDPL
jgi:hypothetical protein